MQFQAYLYFDGNCEAAFELYQRCFGGKINAMLKYAGSAAEGQVPAAWRDKILHAHLAVGDAVLMASDAPPGRYHKPQGFSVSVQIDDSGKAQRIFNTLAEGGNVTMPFQKTFFAAGFGMLFDRFGIPWMVNCSTAG